jgi:hypothetical protein
MSLAKPVLEYVNGTRTKANILGSARTFKRLLRYRRPSVHFFVLTEILAYLRVYTFTLEPPYTAQIIQPLLAVKDVLSKSWAPLRPKD